MVNRYFPGRCFHFILKYGDYLRKYLIREYLTMLQANCKDLNTFIFLHFKNEDPYVSSSEQNQWVRNYNLVHILVIVLCNPQCSLVILLILYSSYHQYILVLLIAVVITWLVDNNGKCIKRYIQLVTLQIILTYYIKENIEMTTISSFLHFTFLDATQQYQIPIWSLISSSDSSPQPIKDYIVSNCIKNNKPLIHLDLGISTLKQITSNKIKQPILLNEHFSFYEVQEEKSYLICRPSLKFKSTENFLAKLIAFLNHSIQNQLKIKQNKTGILIEGIEVPYILCKQNKSLLQLFMMELRNMTKKVGQITVLISQKLVPYQTLFILERASICVSRIIKNEQPLVYQCISTTRRGNGFSNQETYIINIKQNKAKVTKPTKIKVQKNTPEYQQMVKSLGFDISNKKRPEEIKNIVYPHLNVQNQNCKQKQQCPCQQDQGLIILDDQQQDQDDIDV